MAILSECEEQARSGESDGARHRRSVQTETEQIKNSPAS